MSKNIVINRSTKWKSPLSSTLQKQSSDVSAPHITTTIFVYLRVNYRWGLEHSRPDFLSLLKLLRKKYLCRNPTHI